MKKSFLFLLTLTILTHISVNSQVIRVNDSTRISVLTCGPYQSEVYAKFGHSGLRVFDDSQGIDLLFNWGIFSYDTDNFYAKFIIGYCDYSLGVTDTKNFLEEYRKRGSSVIEQVLNLNLKEKTDLIDLLTENYKPENRQYRYNFVFDNCATRPRDLITEAINQSHQYIVYHYPEHNPLTYRELITQYVGKNTWLMFGIDLIFGAKSDTIPTEKEAMFLPEILKEEFFNAKIVSVDEPERPLVLKQTCIVPSCEPIISNTKKISFPFLVFLVILLIRIFCFWREIKLLGKKYLKIDSTLLISTGLIGCIAFFLTFISVHPMVGHNFNILWLMPLNLVAGVFIWFKPKRKILFYYFIIYLILILISWGVYASQIQALNIAFIPIILTMMLVAISWIIRCDRAFHNRKSLFGFLKNYSKN